MGGLTWLHLSDWHQGNREFDRQVVGDALIEDLERRATISPDLAKIDFIVFSGDVAHSGKPEEYQAAKVEFFDRLLRATGLAPEQLFIVPGNHDLNRDEFELLPPALLKPLESDTEVQKWIIEDRQRGLVLQPFNSFTKFVIDYTKQKNPDFANIRRLDVDGKKIALLGLNSAWMCARHTDIKGEVDDEGYVLVGEPQIHQPVKDISDADIKIAILHHPFEWLNEFDRRHIKERLINECDFILNGHQHTPDARQISRNNGFYVHISTGASYLDRISKDPLFINAYNLVHFDFETNQGVVFLRRWSDRQNIWLEDTDTCTPNGRRPFSLVSALTDTSPVQIIPEKKTSIVAPESVSTIIPRQIPPPPADFKGREEEISDILANFDKGATITGLRGMAGVGKTALALVLAGRLKERFPDGQIFINLQGTSKNPLSPAEAIAHVIHAYHPTDRLPKNYDELRGLYFSILSGKNVLLLLDNAADKGQVEQLLPPANCTVLITSRKKFTLPGLKEKDLDVLPPNEACELLLEISRRIGDHAEGLASLCGCLPLALRNAASALAERIDLGVIEYEQRLIDKMERLELVKASFSLSYDLLPSLRKKQWCHLSIFTEDFDRNGAAAVWMMGNNPTAEALSDLVRWSLVNFISSFDSEEGRYRLHDLASLYAESLLSSTERADAHYRHAKHYLKVLNYAGRLYEKGRSDILLGLELFDREWANIKAGQVWSETIFRTTGKSKKDVDLRLAMKLVESLTEGGVGILELRLHPPYRIQWYEAIVSAAQMSKHRETEGAHLINLGNAYNDLGDARKAIEYYERALSIERKIGNQRNIGGVQNNLGNAYSMLGEAGKAIEYYNQSLKIDCKIRDQKNEGLVLSNLGNAYADLDETRKAIEYFGQALEIACKFGDQKLESDILANLGRAYADLGKTYEAIDYCKQALEIVRKIGHQRTEGDALCNLGRAYSDQDDAQKAIEYYKLALEIVRKIGHQRTEGEILCGLGKTYADIGETQKAIECCVQGLEIARKIGNQRTEGDALCNMGIACENKDNTGNVIDYFERSLIIVRKIKYRRGEGNALFGKSLALDKLGQRKDAIDQAEAALKIFELIESPLAEKIRSRLAEWKET